MGTDRLCGFCGETATYNGKAKTIKCKFCGEKNKYDDISDDLKDTINSPTESLDLNIEPTDGSGKTSDLKKKEDQVFSKEAVSTIINVLFDSVAKKRGDFWKLSKDEDKAISESGSKVLNKRLAPKIGNWGEEVVLGSCLVAIILTKMGHDREINKGKISSPQKQGFETGETSGNSPQSFVSDSPVSNPAFPKSAEPEKVQVTGEMPSWLKSQK